MRKRSTLKLFYAFPVNDWVKDMQINNVHTLHLNIG